MKLIVTAKEVAVVNSLENTIGTIVNTVLDLQGRKYRKGSSQSCYAKVAFFLKDHAKNLNDNWHIFFFGNGSGSRLNNVAHACLYDEHGKPLADTYLTGGGKLLRVGDKVQYETPENVYPLLMGTSVKNFKQDYLQ